MSIIDDISDMYEPVKQLGKGTFSEVVLCNHRLTGEKVNILIKRLQ